MLWPWPWFLRPAARTTRPAESGSAGRARERAPDAEPVELVVFAAASMEETLTEIQGMYASVAPNVTLVFNFDSSGTLKTQIQNAAPTATSSSPRGRSRWTSSTSRPTRA